MSAGLRLVARLDVKGPDLVKGIQLEGVRKLGDPSVFARRYYDEGADEILYLDAVASLYKRDTLADIVRRTIYDVFVPITVGGGLRSVEDVELMLRAGADKIAINTAATHRPEIISEIARRFGSQCMVAQIDAKQIGSQKWEAYRDGGRERTGLDVVAWAKQVEALGAGEILLTSVDREGTRKGFDVDLVRVVCDAVSVPVIASGGMGSSDHLIEVASKTDCCAVAVAWLLHFQQVSLSQLKIAATEHGLPIRVL